MTFDSATGIITLASSVLTTTDINGGTIDATVIGGATPAAITGTAIQPYLVELADIASRFSKLEGSKATDQLSDVEIDEILTGKQIVFSVSETPIEFEGKLLFELKFKEVTESKRGKKGEDSDSEITEVPMEVTSPEVEEEL